MPFLGWTLLLSAQLLSLTAGLNSISTATYSSAVTTHTITVGNGDHKFRPDVTQAEVGDIIEFQFFPPNHSVVRAEYKYPCIPYEMTGIGKTGFFSGFHPVDAFLTNPPTWHVKINDSNPIFFYCSAVGSCINYGMVGVINPNATTSLEVQRQLAEDSAYMLQPGDSFPSEGSLSTTAQATSSSSSSTMPATVTLTTSATSAAATTSAAAASGSHSGVSGGAIGGIVVGCLAILGLAAALFFYIGRSKTLKQEVERGSTVPPPSNPSMYQHHSFLSPKERAMTDASSRRSGAASPGLVPYDTFAAMGMAGHDQKPGYVVNVEETAYNRNSNTRSPTEAGFGNAPIRHPSVLLNPNDPREMDSPDRRYADGYGHF